MKKAILIVSVGTSQLEALEHTTLRLGEEVTERFAEYTCYVAFSSKHILRKMNEKSQTPFLGIAEAFEQMYVDGVEEVIVQSTNLLNGLESDSMLAQVEENRTRFASVRVGRPLLNTKEDYIKTLEVMLETVSLEEGEALLCIGHGTNHLSNAT